MKRHHRVGFSRAVSLPLGLAVLLLGAQLGETQNPPIPTQVNYQGRLAYADGTVVPDGDYALTFRLFTRLSGGSPIWEEVFERVVVRNGVFSILLGSTNPMRHSHFTNPVFLEIQIAGEPPLQPRQPVASVPYALRTEVTRSIVNGAVTTPKLADSAVTASKLASDLNSLAKVSGNLLNGRPADSQRPAGWLALSGPLVVGPGSPWGQAGIFMDASTQNSFIAWNNRSWLGFAITQPVGGNYLEFSSSGGGSGEEWRFVSAGLGRVFTVAGTNVSHRSMRVEGNLAVTGTVSKGGGSFKIDHPLEPEKKYLYHSFVESPDMKNVYDGVAVLDRHGEAVVELPRYFEALNRDYRYQLTCVGGYAPVYVKQEVRNNRFVIAGGTSGLRVSWQVTGIRQDPWADANRIQPEVDKPTSEQGTYLYPEVYGGRVGSVGAP